ncbi:MAG: hypothetical protein U1F76_01955 [Candidatus Competibacteraceae bacterium]
MKYSNSQPVRKMLLCSTLLFSLVLCFTTSAARASTVDYTLTGNLGDVFSFTISQTPTPTSCQTVVSDCFAVSPPTLVTINGPSALDIVQFYTPSNSGGLVILSGTNPGLVLINQASSSLFNDDLSNPVMLTGSFQGYNVNFGGPVYTDNFAIQVTSTTSTTVPIPATIGLFSSALAGFGIVGKRQFHKPKA